MRIERLTLRGFLRVRDALTLDLTDVPSGLIALVGPNGAGKSTLLEAAPATLFRSFLSRGDVLDYATARDSYLEAQIALDGRGVYRARVNVDGPKRGSDALLEAVQPGGGRVPLNDGKVSTYDAAIAATFPSKTLLLASAFAAQNKAGSFIALDKKARKTLFAQLLGIERYQAMSETARQAAALVEETRARLGAVRAELARGTGDDVLVGLDAQAQQLQVTGGQAEIRRVELQETIATLEARLGTMQDAVAAYGAATLRLTALRTDLASRRAERQAVEDEAARLEGDRERELARLEARRRQDRDALVRARAEAEAALARDLGDIASVRAAEVTECGNKIAGNEQIRGMADQIRTAVARQQAIDAQLRTLREANDATAATLIADRSSLAGLERERAGLATTTAALSRAQADAALLGTVPCGGAGAYARCQFLTNAADAQARIPELSDTLAAAGLRLDPEIARLRTVIRAAEADLQARREQVQALEREQPDLQRYAKYDSALAAAEARIAELTARQQKADVDATAAQLAAQTRHAARLGELDTRAQTGEAEAVQACLDLASRYADQETARAARALALEDTLTRLALEYTQAEQDLTETTARHERASAVQRELAVARAAWDGVTATLATVSAERAALERRRGEVQQALGRLADIDRRLARLATEALDWQLLAKAFGRDGLPVLEIDAAGPTLSALTNDLLAACFGSRFSVELVTQQATADGKGLKEAFTVAVTDNATGEARDIADLSGGEQVIVAEALMAATGVYVNTRSVAPIRTCWRDETTGALDPENAARYFAMLRRAHQLGGFHHTWFVSHNPDISAMADAQIRIEGGTATIVYPPFTREAAA